MAVYDGVELVYDVKRIVMNHPEIVWYEDWYFSVKDKKNPADPFKTLFRSQIEYDFECAVRLIKDDLECTIQFSNVHNRLV